MKLTDELFVKYSPVEERLISYGFRKEAGSFYYSQPVHNGEFDLQVTVSDGRIDARLIEKDFNEEFTLINVGGRGEFVSSLRKECEDVLIGIREKGFKQQRFHLPQTERIAELIKEKYGIELELLKFGSTLNYIIRNPVSKKWIGLIMYARMTGTEGEKTEHMSLNFKKDAGLYNGKGIYHPYNKRNSNWISVILDDTLTDQQIMDLVAIGYEKTKK